MFSFGWKTISESCPHLSSLTAVCPNLYFSNNYVGVITDYRAVQDPRMVGQEFFGQEYFVNMSSNLPAKKTIFENQFPGKLSFRGRRADAGYL